MTNRCNAIILAAGEGTRMKSKKPKVLHEICNRPMVEYVVEAARNCGAEKILVVVGHQGEEVKGALENQNLMFAVQEKRLGTGHAVMQAMDAIEEDKDILVLYGDTPLIQAATLKRLLEVHRQDNNGATAISAFVADPAGYGRILRDSTGKFLRNVEDKDATAEEKKINEINTGIYVYQGRCLKEALRELKNDNAQGEYYLPDTLEILCRKGYGVNAMAAEDVTEFFGVNSRVQLAQASALLRERIVKEHMENGVTMIDPSRTYIDPSVKIGRDTVLLPGVILEGNTIIGEDCIIGPDSRLTNVEVADGVSIQYTTALDAKIGAKATVGPYAYIRPNSVIGEKVKIGDFVEVKNSVIGKGTKVSHLTYIGDSDVGERINFGCGTVTVNYDGTAKYRTVIEDDVFIGCNTNLVAPVTVGKNAYIAAGSTITEDIPENVLAIARARQTVIEGWTKRQ